MDRPVPGAGRYGGGVNASPATQRRLLDLQAVDVTLAQLAHRRGALPELADIEQLDQQLAALVDDTVRVESEINDLGREQQRLERDVAQVRQRAQRDQERLDAGTITTPRELESLQHEIESLHKRQFALEDQVLELMERREEAEQRLTAVTTEVARLSERRSALVTVRDAAWGQIDAEATVSRSARETIAGEIPADLAGLYEKLRQQLGGVGAAALRGNRCEGCRLELSPSDLSRVRAAAADAVVRCEECGRILVRVDGAGT